MPGRSDPLAQGAGEGVEVVRSEERLVVGMRPEVAGTARIRTEVDVHHVRHLVPVTAEDVEVIEIPVPDGAEDSGEIETTAEGHVSIPVVEERLFVVRRPVVVKRLEVRRVRRPAGRKPVEGDLRAQRVVVEVEDAEGVRRTEVGPSPPWERVRVEEDRAG